MRYRTSETDVRERAARVKLLLLDVDGVLTDGSLIIHHDGEESKIFHAHDGLAIRLLQKAGIEVGLISGRKSAAVARRAADLEIELLAQGSLDKKTVYEEMLRRRQLSDLEVAYVGDDLVDIPVLERVGLAVAVANATPIVQSRCHLITSIGGGRGAVREVSELLLQAQGRWEEVIASYIIAGSS